MLGGTHGDEPAGYLAAVVLVERATVGAGRLIVIPRANASGFTHNFPQEGHPSHFLIATPAGNRRFTYGARATNPIHQWPDPQVYTLQRIRPDAVRHRNSQPEPGVSGQRERHVDRADRIRHHEPHSPRACRSGARPARSLTRVPRGQHDCGAPAGGRSGRPRQHEPAVGRHHDWPRGVATQSPRAVASRMGRRHRHAGAADGDHERRPRGGCAAGRTPRWSRRGVTGSTCSHRRAAVCRCRSRRRDGPCPSASRGTWQASRSSCGIWARWRPISGSCSAAFLTTGLWWTVASGPFWRRRAATLLTIRGSHAATTDRAVLPSSAGRRVGHGPDRVGSQPAGRRPAGGAHEESSGHRRSGHGGLGARTGVAGRSRHAQGRRQRGRRRRRRRVRHRRRRAERDGHRRRGHDGDLPRQGKTAVAIDYRSAAPATATYPEGHSGNGTRRRGHSGHGGRPDDGARRSTAR